MPDALLRLLPPSIRELVEPLLSPSVLLVLVVISILTFIASLVGVPYFLARLPPDYFSSRERAALDIPDGKRSRFSVVLRVLKNLFGLVLLVLGIAMLVLPGQALLTILVALFFLDFPGKRRFERWIISRRVVLRTINALRNRVGRAPIEVRTSWLPPSRRPPAPPA